MQFVSQIILSLTLKQYLGNFICFYFIGQFTFVLFDPWAFQDINLKQDIFLNFRKTSFSFNIYMGNFIFYVFLEGNRTESTW